MSASTLRTASKIASSSSGVMFEISSASSLVMLRSYASNFVVTSRKGFESFAPYSQSSETPSCSAVSSPRWKRRQAEPDK